MVRYATFKDLEKKLTHKLLSESNPQDRCPNLKIDRQGPYCGRDLKEGEKILEQRRMVCDNYSLQLWCLDKTRYNICI
ncbi:MAG: hypothetical protein Q8N63_06070 [Nanoarchaeota archaeon]|nr:hypothetical protein [Nanoarchaeota archaeon]